MNLVILLHILLGTAPLAAQPAAPPAGAASVSVARIPCAAAVSFGAPYPWRYSSDLHAITDAIALVVTVDASGDAAELLRPQNIGQRVLYADGWPVEILALDPGRDSAEGASGAAPSRALVLAPFAELAPGAALRVYFGDEMLPERVDAAHRKQSLSESVGIVPLAPDSSYVPGWTVAAGTPRQQWIAGLVDWAAACK